MLILLDSLHSQETHQYHDDHNDINQPLNTYKTCTEVINTHIHQELSYLISKQSHQHISNSGDYGSYRCKAVEWILSVVAHHSFNALTAVLAVNYLDRFLDRFEEMEINKKPWMIQLAAVSCLAVAAKVDETCVPLLQDLQVRISKQTNIPSKITVTCNFKYV